MSNFTSMTDEQLQLLARKGETAAEEVLLERYIRSVRICSRPLFLAGGDSEDLFQEGMMGLLSAVREYRSEKNCSFKTFAEVCIQNRLNSAVRSASRKKHAPLNDGVPLDVLSDESKSPSSQLLRDTEEQVLARESANELLSTYSRCLSKFESQVLERYLSGLSNAEIARELGRDSKAIDNAVQRIRRKLARPAHGENSEKLLADKLPKRDKL